MSRPPERGAAASAAARCAAAGTRSPDLDDALTRITGDEPDDVLARAMQAGSRDAVAAVYDRHGAVAYGLAYRITGDAQLAEDAVQDAFVSMWRQCARFDPERGRLRSWLLTIVHHRAIDAVRRRSGRAERALPDGPDEFIARYGDPEGETEAAMDAQAVREAVQRVPEEQRRTIELAYFGGLTHTEIARVMDVPAGTVKSRLRIGLAKMREYLRAKVLE